MIILTRPCVLFSSSLLSLYTRQNTYFEVKRVGFFLFLSRRFAQGRRVCIAMKVVSITPSGSDTIEDRMMRIFFFLSLSRSFVFLRRMKNIPKRKVQSLAIGKLPWVDPLSGVPIPIQNGLSQEIHFFAFFCKLWKTVISPLRDAGKYYWCCRVTNNENSERLFRSVAVGSARDNSVVPG